MKQASAPLAGDRRSFLRTAAGGLFLFQIAGVATLASCRDAKERGADFAVLTKDDVRRLEAFAEALVPGAKAAGIAHFVDANLARPPAESLLTARYLDVLPPHDVFYRDGLAALDGVTGAQFGKPFASLDAGQMSAVISPLLGGKVDGWKGPPPPLFYLAVRSDAVDLVYGTEAAFARMKVPYAAHIAPPGQW